MKINIKEPYKTALIISLTTTTILGVAYLIMPNGWRIKISDFVKNALNKKKKDVVQ